MGLLDTRSALVNKTVLSRLALCYISLRGTLKEPLLNLSVSSVRSHGEWEGPIYVITDQPNCVPQTTKAIYVDLNGCYKNMAYKLFKTLVLDLVPSEDYILYLDTDIMIAKPLRGLREIPAIAQLAGLASGPVPNFVGVTQSMIMPKRYKGKRNQKFLYWHGGIALVSRERSARCLRHWRREYYQCTRDGDQVALKRAIESRHCIFTDMDPVFSWPTSKNLHNHEFAIFNHFTRTGRLKLKHGLSVDDLNLAGRLLFGKQLPDEWWLKNDESCILDSLLYAPLRPHYVISKQTCGSLPPFDTEPTQTSLNLSSSVATLTPNLTHVLSPSTRKDRPSISSPSITSAQQKDPAYSSHYRHYHHKQQNKPASLDDSRNEIESKTHHPHHHHYYHEQNANEKSSHIFDANQYSTKRQQAHERSKVPIRRAYNVSVISFSHRKKQSKMSDTASKYLKV